VRGLAGDGEGLRMAGGFAAAASRARERALVRQGFSGVAVPVAGEGAFRRYAVVDFELEWADEVAGGLPQLREVERGADWMALPGRWAFFSGAGAESFVGAPVIAMVRDGGGEGEWVAAAVLLFGPDGGVKYPAEEELQWVCFGEAEIRGGVLQLVGGVELETLPRQRVHAVSGKLEGNFHP